jgi:glucose/arabinose dehydrogenase
MKKAWRLVFMCLLLLFVLYSCYPLRKSKGGGQRITFSETRYLNPADVVLPEGYKIEVIASGLTFPTAVTADENGTVYALEAGYSYGEVFDMPRLVRIGKNGELTTIATGIRNGPWNGFVYHDGAFYVAEGGEMEGGRILKITKNGTKTILIENLPSIGDHHTNGPAIGPDGYIYFGQGSATNSGIVGPDNAEFGWLKRKPNFHDIPCKDIVLVGQNFDSDNPLKNASETEARTGAFLPFGTKADVGQVINGSIPCTGAIMRIPATGGNPELVAWGLRNPFGLAFSPSGQLYTTENGYDTRGSRPVWGSPDVLWKVENGKWYGFPDFSAGMPLNTPAFNGPLIKRTELLLKNQPGEIPKPAAVLGVHSSSNGFDFSTSAAFGYLGEAFIAQFGDMAPAAGKILGPVGFKIVRVNVNTGVVEQFAANKGKENGPATYLKKGGLERPVSARFSPDGKALYIADFGIMAMTEQGPAPKENTGVIWKITKK